VNPGDPADPATPGEAALGPTSAELAMIAAAVEAVWPRPVAAPADDRDPAHQAWRFSGRWWNKPTPLARERPGL
jgi:hypothetical protein